MPGSIPHDMDCDVAEEETSQHHSLDENTNNTGAPTNLQILEVRERLKKHKKSDDNHLKILFTQDDFASTSTAASQGTQSSNALLREKGIHSYSFSPKELKQPSFILRGLAANTEMEDIKVEIDEVVPNTIAKVMNYKNQRNTVTSLFLVSLLPGKKLSDISNVRTIQYQIVSWEKPKKKFRNSMQKVPTGGHISKNSNSS
ncbi:uncharacterized protein LOC131996141 [Stomoxys calcitrans]|uniref:uncharacterized protein LOC131996141 n=1 Tax=Stomoxys calcitrans TaxID=35570 RepID=UPI0027E37FD6|nr:uncharacterized protein LOC131996141 [Stomoxys calcitrans]